jgi:hypothetical protein
VGKETGTDEKEWEDQTASSFRLSQWLKRNSMKRFNLALWIKDNKSLLAAKEAEEQSPEPQPSVPTLKA